MSEKNIILTMFIVILIWTVLNAGEYIYKHAFTDGYQARINYEHGN